MSNPMFLDDEPQAVRADCQRLQEIVRTQLRTHLAFLRAVQSELDVQTAADWTEQHKLSVLQHGFLGAFDRGEVSTDLLRQAAYDPELLAELVTRGAEEGDRNQWPTPNEYAEPSTVAEFAEAWKRTLADYGAECVPPPSLTDVNTKESFVGYWITPGLASGRTCRVSALVTDAAQLRLRFLDRTWGILAVRRMGPHAFRIESLTGVFLAWPPSEEIRVRAAARGASPETTDSPSPITLEATPDGIVLNISVSAKAKDLS